VEQSHKQVKHALSWSQYQIRSDVAIRRHWRLVCCAVSFCWWAYERLPTDEPTGTAERSFCRSGGKGKKAVPGMLLAAGLEGAKGWLEPYVMLMRYWRAFSGMPPPLELKALIDWVFSD
jgi:hypothetical protein